MKGTPEMISSESDQEKSIPDVTLHEREIALLLGEEKPVNRNEAQFFLAGQLFKENHGNKQMHQDSGLWKNAVMEYWIKSGFSSAFRIFVESPEFEKIGKDFSLITLDQIKKVKEEQDTNKSSRVE